MKSLAKNLLFAVGFALILWLGYVVFIQQSDELVTSDSGTSDAAVQGQEFLALLQQVRAINLNGAILNDTRFHSLVDLREQVVEEPYGRNNPFAKVGQ